jgi:hypothetical protein
MMKSSRRGALKEEGPVAVEAVATARRGKPLRAEIPEADSA